MPKGLKTSKRGAEGVIFMCPCGQQICSASPRAADYKIELHKKYCRLGKTTHIDYNDDFIVTECHNTKNKHLAIEVFNKFNPQQLKF